MGILDKVAKYREEEEKLKWEGTFAEYLELVKEKPWIAQSAHSRVYNMIKDAGVEEVDGVKRYKFFSHQLYGLETALERLVEEYFHPAAKRLDVRKRILLLMGPVSGGKSTLVTMLKRGLNNIPERIAVPFLQLKAARCMKIRFTSFLRIYVKIFMKNTGFESKGICHRLI